MGSSDNGRSDLTANKSLRPISGRNMKALSHTLAFMGGKPLEDSEQQGNMA